MTDDTETPDTGETLLECLLLVAGAVVFVGATLVGCHALAERFRRKDREEEIER